jgi:murein DD-endopeptidase MepM/ murein hydrolase activator NlpD
MFANYLPRTHMYAAGAVAVLTTALLVLAPSEDVSAYRDTQLNHHRANNLLNADSQLAVAMEQAIKEAPPAPESDYLQVDETVTRGDSLSAIFKRMSLSQADLFALANTSDYADELRRLQPGETFSAILNLDGSIKELVYERSPLESFRFTPTDSGYSGEKLAREPLSVPAYRSVNISHSLFLDGEKAGLNHAQIMQIANIFGWDIDFALDIQPGDNFSVLFEEQYLDGKKIGNGNILGTEFTNRGKTYRAVRYVNADGMANYYSPEGQPMKKAFLRAPLDFTRVSSNFNPNRLHPILKTKRPHRGVDYAAPTGTPIYAAGDGKVVRAGYTPANGNFVVIQHGGNYTTKYLHLHKRSVKVGQTVDQRQIIGSVGSTGYATGPHLHYEFLVGGVHTDPRTVKLPQAEPIGKREMASFMEQTAPLVAELTSFQSFQVASLSTKGQ